MTKKYLLLHICFLLCAGSFTLSLPEMIEIKGTDYTMGSDILRNFQKIDDDGVPETDYSEHRVRLDAYKISKYEVTFKEYFEFLDDTNYKTYAELGWLSDDGKGEFIRIVNGTDYADYPVTRITYEDALIYCKWLQEKTGKMYRLPTEAEWEYAATGGQMVLYPWGNEYKQLDMSHSNEYLFDATFKKDIHPVGKFTQDKSPAGIYGMYGNASEWCLDAYDPLYYRSEVYENPLCIIRTYFNDIVFRGAAGYSMENGDINVKRRLFSSPLYYGETRGFRVVQEETPIIFNKGSENECTYYYANAVLNDSNVNIRSTPSLSGKKMFQLSKNEAVRVYWRSSNKMTIDGKSNYWYCIRRLKTDYESEMSTGWIFGAYLDLNEITFH